MEQSTFPTTMRDMRESMDSVDVSHSVGLLLRAVEQIATVMKLMKLV